MPQWRNTRASRGAGSTFACTRPHVRTYRLSPVSRRTSTATISSTRAACRVRTSTTREFRRGPTGMSGALQKASATALLVVAGVDVDAGHALSVEHVVVASIVLERQLQVEPERPQLRHRALLEVARRLVVAVVAHDQQIPAQLVAEQPTQRLGLHADRAGRQQDDPQPGIEHVEQPSHLVDHEIVAAGLEERLPVAERTLEVVLAPGRVGQDA